MHFDLFDPVFNVVEGVPIVDGIGKDDAHGSSVVGLCDSFEPFLSCGIPDLKFDLMAVHVDKFCFEIDACMLCGIPMVERCEVWKLFSQNLRRRLVLPTPLLPMMSNLTR